MARNFVLYIRHRKFHSGGGGGGDDDDEDNSEDNPPFSPVLSMRSLFRQHWDSKISSASSIAFLFRWWPL